MAFTGSTSTHVDKALGEFDAGDQAVLGQVVDVRDRDGLLRFISSLNEEWGSVSALVYSAGISPKRDGERVPVGEIDMDEWNDVLTVNLTGALLCVQAVLPGMVERKSGRIVMIGSMAARAVPRFAGASYVASKAGLAGLARSIAVEYGASGITANTVSPGNVASNMTGDAHSPQNQAAAARIPVGRIGLPEDFAGVVAFLCSREAAFINGVTIDVTGGEAVTP